MRKLETPMLQNPAANRATECESGTNPVHLRDLKRGGQDKLGNTVQEIMWLGAHYTVYCSDKGIYVHFSDCADIEKAQRARFSEICPELCELRYLTTQMRGGRPSSREERKHSLYEHNMAQAHPKQSILLISVKDTRKALCFGRRSPCSASSAGSRNGSSRTSWADR